MIVEIESSYAQTEKKTTVKSSADDMKDSHSSLESRGHEMCYWGKGEGRGKLCCCMAWRRRLRVYFVVIVKDAAPQHGSCSLTIGAADFRWITFLWWNWFGYFQHVVFSFQGMRLMVFKLCFLTSCGEWIFAWLLFSI